MAIPRSMLILEGHQRIGLTKCGVRYDVVLKPGDCLHYVSEAWDLHFWEKPCRFFAMVFHRRCTRLLLVTYRGRSAEELPISRYLHSQSPFPALGRQILTALDLSADGAAGTETSVHLFRSLIHATRDHFANDLAPSMSARTGMDIREYLIEHLSEAVTRDHVALALGLHRSYISTLCSRQGRTFKLLLEDVRCERARQLLRSPAKPQVSRVARLCGFQSTSAFIRMFRRRVGMTPDRFRAASRGISHAVSLPCPPDAPYG
jgi:AraC-like DNA-binding protein